MDKALARITSIEPYVCDPPVIKKKARELLKKLEEISEDDNENREDILKELFGKYYKLAFPTSGFKCDFGFNIHFHGLAVINYNVVMLDTSPINIGADAFIEPGSCLACAGHGIRPSQRKEVFTRSPITLEDKVWLGANVTVIGGVTIGEGSIIGAGSVVAKDIPAGVISAGCPCKVIRKSTDEDKVDYEI